MYLIRTPLIPNGPACDLKHILTMGETEEVVLDPSTQESGDTTAQTGSTDTGTGDELTKYRTLAENYKIRAEKAEAKLKARPDTHESENLNKAEPKEHAATPSTSPAEIVMLSKLYAKGFDDEQVSKAQKIAAIEGIPLDQAVSTELFVAWNTKRDEDLKAQKAQLRASNGSRVAVKKDLKTPGLTPEEHKALYKEKYG